MILTELFGECKKTQILEILLENKDEELSAPEIEEMSDFSKGTVYKYLKKLLDEGIIEEARKVGKTQFYKLNLDNHVARLLLILENLIIKQKLECEMITETLETGWNLDTIISLTIKKFGLALKTKWNLVDAMEYPKGIEAPPYIIEKKKVLETQYYTLPDLENQIEY